MSLDQRDAHEFIWTGDNFDPETSNVLLALISRFNEAKISNQRSVTLWGSGAPLREFLHGDNLASACLHLLPNYEHPLPINIGRGCYIH